MLSECTTESLCRRQSTHSIIVILAVVSVVIARHVVLYLTVASSKADLVIHCQATLAPFIVTIRVFFFLVDWVSGGHKLVVVLILWGQVEQSIGTLHVPNIVVLG